MELRFSPLFSGSSGNAIYVGCGETHILVDAGLSGTKITNELRKIGVEPRQLSGIFTTHEHSDHTQGVGILSRKFGLPVYATEGTWDGMAAKVGNIDPVLRCMLTPEEDFYLDGLNILPFSTPHDANQPVGFRFECGGAVFCIATDLGCVKKGWMSHVSGADAVLLESNYDPDMLTAGSYPYDLKRRILSNRGHLCNEDAGACALSLVNAGARHIVLGHLSKENNFPELARRCTEDALLSGGVVPGRDMRLDVASRDGVTGIFGVESRLG